MRKEYSEYYVFQKHLTLTLKKIKTLENKMYTCTSDEVVNILRELSVLRKIETFLWHKLN